MARYRKGDYKVKCDLSGAIVNASDCRMTHDGLFVLKHLWSPRHPQESVAMVRENRLPPVVRAEGTEQFIEPGDITADDL